MITDKVVAIDFDGTVTKENLYPRIGDLRDGVVDAINTIAKNNIVCIWTCREGKELNQAFNFLNQKNITFHYINASPYDKYNFKMRKIIADYYIDDRNIFADIDWKKIKQYFLESNE